MSNLYRYLLPKAGGGWLRRYYQHKKLLVSMELTSSDAVPMLPIPIFDFTRTIDIADASTISSTTVDGWTVSDDGVINGASTSNAVLIRTTQCWPNHLQSTHQRIKTKSSSSSSSSSTTSTTSIQQQQQQQQQQHDTSTDNLQQRQSENDREQKLSSNGDTDTNTTDSVQLLSRPFIRWYGNLNTTIGLESKVQRSGFCAIRSPIFPFEGASLQGLYSFLEIQCRYIPVAVNNTELTRHQSTKLPSNTFNEQNNNNNNENHLNQSTRIPNSDSQQQQQQPHGPARIFTLNLRVTSALNDDIYQGHLALDHPATTMVANTSTISDEASAGNSNDDLSIQQLSLPPFRTFIIPFDELILTARGREREFQRRLMGSVDIESIGFLLMDNVEGPFQFDIAQIRAVNRLEDGTVFESPSQISRTTPVSSKATMNTMEPSPDDKAQNEIPPTTK
jgi:Complex I intermediate-associated protein 30 (CIA30)